MRQDSLQLVSRLIESQNFSQRTSDSTLRSSLTCFCNWLMRVFTAGSFFLEYCLLSLRFSLISSKVSSEIELLSVRTLLDLGMALSTAVLIAVTIKSAYLSRSLVDRCPGKSAEPSASSSVDSNTSRSVWLNLYLVWLVNVFLCVCVGGGGGGGGGHQLRFLWVGDRCPSHHIFEIECHVLLNLVR